MSAVYDVSVIGGGIVGLASARALLKINPSLRLILIEKEERLALHQTGHNSGVIHSGIYYHPGSEKAKLCVLGGRLLIEFCKEHGIAYRKCGKLIVAVNDEELPRLDELYQRGILNKIDGLSLLDSGQIGEVEPNVRGIQAIHLPNVSIVDFACVANVIAMEIERAGAKILTSARVKSLNKKGSCWRIKTTKGEFQASFIINCSGLHADMVARMAKDHTPIRIIPFRGEYYTIIKSRSFIVNGLVYPVPDPSLPFLGVHFTKTMDGGVHVGPNAVLALKREGYGRTSFSIRDCLELISSSPFLRMAARHWKVGLKEMRCSLSKKAFLNEARKIVPSINCSDLIPDISGVRAQAIDASGNLLDDFVLSESAGAAHVYNAPSPAATACLGIGEVIAHSFEGLN